MRHTEREIAQHADDTAAATGIGEVTGWFFHEAVDPRRVRRRPRRAGRNRVGHLVVQRHVALEVKLGERPAATQPIHCPQHVQRHAPLVQRDQKPTEASVQGVDLVQQAEDVGLAPGEVLTAEAQEQGPFGVIDIRLKQAVTVAQTLAGVELVTGHVAYEALAKHVRTVIPDAIVLPAIGHEIIEIVGIEQAQRREQVLQGRQQTGVPARHQVGEAVPQLHLHGDAVLQHSPTVVRGLQTRVGGCVLGGQSRTVVHPAIET